MSLKVTDFSYTLKKQHHKTIAKIIFLVLFVYIIVNLVLAYLIFPVRQNSVSMSPDLPDGAFVLTTPLDKNPKRGDIYLLNPHNYSNKGFFKKLQIRFVAFFTAQQILLDQNSNFPCSKNQLRRVVGIPGDTIYMRDYVLYICPQGEKHFLTEFELTESKYSITFYAPPANWESDLGVAGNFEKITLKENEYFVLGDNRKSCDDSRLWGVISGENLASRVLLCYFPFNKFKIF